MVELLKYGLKVSLLVAAVALAMGTQARADWETHEDPEAEPVEIEYNPEWEKYAFELPHANGPGNVSFEQLAKGGQPFVLYWWLADCPLCHLQMPYVQQFKKLVDEHDMGIRVVSICVDDKLESCSDYIREKDLAFETLFDQRARKTNDKFKVKEHGTPLTYVFAGGGEMVEYMTGFRSNYSKSVLKLLGIPYPEGMEE